MRTEQFARIGLGTILVLLCTLRANAACLSINDAGQHVGEIRCVRGRVLRVHASSTGTHFLNFCDDHRTCPFNVVVFSRDLRDIGDVRVLTGQEIEIDGTIQSYRGRPEIVLKTRRQLRGNAANLPAVPRDYDVSRRGSFSAGSFGTPRKTSSSKRQPQDRTDPEASPERDE